MPWPGSEAGGDTALYFPRGRDIYVGDPPPPTYSAGFLKEVMARLWGWAEDSATSVALINDALARLLATPAPTTQDAPT